jgi:hypothetical protein
MEWIEKVGHVPEKNWSVNKESSEDYKLQITGEQNKL